MNLPSLIWNRWSLIWNSNVLRLAICFEPAVKNMSFSLSLLCSSRQVSKVKWSLPSFALFLPISTAGAWNVNIIFITLLACLRWNFVENECSLHFILLLGAPPTIANPCELSLVVLLTVARMISSKTILFLLIAVSKLRRVSDAFYFYEKMQNYNANGAQNMFAFDLPFCVNQKSQREKSVIVPSFLHHCRGFFGYFSKEIRLLCLEFILLSKPTAQMIEKRLCCPD